MDFINTVTELVSLGGKIDSYESVLKKMKEKLNILPSWSTDIARRERNKAITEQIYLMLKKKIYLGILLHFLKIYLIA